MKTIPCLLAAAALLCGCGKPMTQSSAPEYTNSFEGEINQRVLTVQYGYAAGFAAATIKEENEKLEKLGGQPLPLPPHPADMATDEAGAVQETIKTFWYLQTNSVARQRADQSVQ